VHSGAPSPFLTSIHRDALSTGKTYSPTKAHSSQLNLFDLK
jgi:hypothetical protein